MHGALFASAALAVDHARQAFDHLGLSEASARWQMLERLAQEIEARRVAIVSLCADETSLRPEELAPEFARMVATLRMFASLIREGSWVRGAIDRAPADEPARAQCIGPPHDVRRMLVPLATDGPGVVVVLGASNFPLAYGVCGGDVASALAAGCAVVVKEHPAHPRLGRLLAQICVASCAPVAYCTHDAPDDPRVVRELVGHTRVVAVGFTGSRRGGLAIEAMARARPVPIPVFAEMSASNVVVVTREALGERAGTIAEQLAASIIARAGQQCTNTGLLLLDGDAGAAGSGGVPQSLKDEPLCKALWEAMRAGGARDMVSARVRDAYEGRVEAIRSCGDRGVHAAASTRVVAGPRGALPMLVFADNPSDLRHDVLSEEIFGPACVVARIDLRSPNALSRVLWGGGAPSVWPSLVSSVFVSHSPSRHEGLLVAELSRTCGRVAVNSVPTGVRVCGAMVHGGPFPATNAPQTTAVGAMAIERWCRPMCWQNCPDALLPEELRDDNPRGIERLVDGVRTRAAVVRRG